MWAPQPEVFTTTCSTPADSKAWMVFRASSTAVSCSPACACSAPQQAWVRGATTSTPFFASTRAVARLCGPKATCWMQPVRSPTVPRLAPWAGVTSGSGARSARDGIVGSSGSHAGSGAGRRRMRPEARAQALEPAHLIEAQARRREREQARVRQQHVEVHPAKEPPEQSAGALALDVRARGLDELPIGHAGGTHGFAGAAAEAEVEMRGGGVGEGDAPLRHRLDEEDAARAASPSRCRGSRRSGNRRGTGRSARSGSRPPRHGRGG